MRPFLAPAAAAALLAMLATAPGADAATRIYSYDSANKTTEDMTEQGLTFIFQKSLLSTRVERVLETNDIGQADVRPASQSDLGPGGLGALIGGARERDLYEILPRGDGRALIGALCPGADRVWLAFGPLRPDEPLRIHALGRDPTTGRSRLCVTLDYNFHGQWALAPPPLPQPDRSDRFNDAPTNRRY
ncbi:MAG TPA: hypothetical protein VKU90_13980 [Caulobacteraceae bacterium]|jgi:hypothetical protein|nr:hypothetical protein [Caulobacteraceae bacterium]